MPDDKEIIATIKTQYDGTGAAEAKQDLSSLPEELRPIASSFAESQSQLDELIAAIGEANSALREHINSLAPAAAGYAQARQEATALRDQFVALYRETGQASDSLSATQKRLRDWAGAKGAIPNQEMQELSRRAAQARREVAALGEQMTALSAQRGGLTGGGAGSGEEEQRSRAMAEVMRLETLTRHELNQEIQRLSAARRAAAAAADTTAYQRLTVQLQTARKAMTDLTAAQNLNKTAWAGQAIQGMQVADTIARLASQAQEGKMQVADLANGVIALSLAFKAGMGPIGLVMAGIQGLQYAYDYFTKESTAALEESREELRKYAEELTQLDQTLQKAASSTRELTLQGMAEGINRTATAMQQAAGEQAANRTLAARQRELELATARGDMTQEAAALELARAQEAHDTRLANLQAEQAARKAAAAEAAADLAKAYSEGMAGAMNNPEIAKWQPVLKVQLPDETELASIDARLKDQHAQLTEEAREQLIAEKSRILEQVDEVRRAVADLVPGLKPTGAQAVEMVRKMQQLNQAFEEGKLSAEQMAGNLSASAQKSREEADSAAQKSAEEKREAEAAREKAELQAAAAERAKGWERLEDASLTEQIGYVERMVSATKEGSDEWEQWSRQLRRLHNQAAAKELESIRRLGQDYGRSDDPAAQRAILRRQRQQLSQLAGRGGLSADLQEQIAREQASVRAAMQHWRAETQKAAAQGQQNLLGAKAPDLQATNKGMQGAVRRINTALEAQARQLERETRAGDKQSMSRIGEKMVRLAAQAEKLTGYTGQYADMVNKLKDSARAQLRTGDGLSAEERKKAEVERKLRAGTQRATTSERAEESRARREQQQQERAARRAAAQQPAAARNAQPAAAAAQGTGAAQAAQGATQAATQAAASAQALTTQLTELQTQLQTQAAAMQEALSACASLAASQASVNAGVKSQLNALKNSIQRLQTRN